MAAGEASTAGAQAVEIDVATARDASELAECLARQGFPSGLRERAGRWRVEVRSCQEARSLAPELSAALERWLEGSAHVALRLQVGERELALRRRFAQ